MSKKIRVIVEFPFATVSDVEEYYELPDNWEQMSEKEQDAYLKQMAVGELDNAGVGSGASVVEVED